MQQKIFALMYALLAGMLWANTLQAATIHDPSLRWSTLETEHFYFHYHDGLEETAQHMAAMAPGIYREITDYFQWQPKDKTHIVITDGYDMANGQATPLPYNHITIFASPPETLNSLEDFDDWLHLVFKHEFVHIVHLDKVGGFPKTLREIFGRTWSYPYFVFFPLFPNTMLPNWYAEGIATHLETDQQQGIGRGQNSYFRGLMQVEVQQNFKTLDQVNMPMVSWPGGTAWYMYGVYFFQFMEDTYGRDTIKALIDDYSSFLIPYMVNANANRVLGKSYYELWAEFEQYMRRRVGNEVAAIEQQGISPAQAITNSGFGTGFSRSDNQGGVYYVDNNNISLRRLMRYDPATKQHQLVSDQLFGDSFDLHPTAGILMVQPEWYHNVRLHNDLYHIDPHSGKQRRLTHQGRYHSASWSPDGQQIIAVHRDAGRFALHLLNADGQLQEILWQAGEQVYIGDIDWSPAGGQLVAAIWRKPLGWNLELFDLNTRQWQAITADSQIEAQPQFNADGSAVVFSADYSGVYNIYLRQLNGNATQQLSNVIGGAFRPTLSADQQRLYYAGFSRNGHELYQLDLEGAPSRQFTPSAPRPTSAAQVEIPTDAGTTAGRSDYQAIKHVYPRYWAPIYFTDEIQSIWQVSTGGSDPLAWHNYQLVVRHDSKNSVNGWLMQYIYDRLTPTLGVQYQREHEFYQDGNSGDPLIVNQVDQIQLFASWPWLQQRQRHAVNLAVMQESIRNITYHPLVPLLPGGNELIQPVDDRLAIVSYQLETYQVTRRAISEHSGISLNLGYAREIADPLYGEGKRVLGEGWWYSSPLGKSVLALRGLAGVQSSTMQDFYFSSVVDLIETPFSPDQTQYALRGYPSGLLQLRGSAINLLTVEWRTHLQDIERGIMLVPIGIRRMHGKLFADAGRTWQWNQERPGNFYHSVGAELNMGLVIGYRVPLQLVVGWAQGLDRYGEQQNYLGLRLSPF